MNEMNRHLLNATRLEMLRKANNTFETTWPEARNLRRWALNIQEILREYPKPPARPKLMRQDT